MNKIKNFNQIAIAGILVLVMGKVAYGWIASNIVCLSSTEVSKAACEVGLVTGESTGLSCFCANH